MSLRDFMARLATNYPREHRRMREIIGEMYDELVMDVDLHRERIAQYEAEKQSLALLRRTLATEANIPTPFARAASPPLDPQAFHFTGKRRPNTPVAGVLVPQKITYSARSNGCTGNDPDTGSPMLLLNTPTPNPVPGRTPLRVTDLGKFLGKTSRNEDHQMGFLERTELALSIAISLLSFHSTYWLEKPWTKESIHFFLKGKSDTRIDTIRPVIMQIVPKAAGTAGALTMPNLSEPKSALLELSILLLELWHYRTLEDCAAQTNSTYKDTPEDRRIAATRWLEMTSNKLTIKYTSAVEGCLAFCAGRIRSWQEDDFRRQICEDIIKSLKDNCKAW